MHTLLCCVLKECNRYLCIILPYHALTDMIMENCGDYDDINDNVPVGDYETTIDPNDYCSTPLPPLSGYEDPMAGLEYEAPVSTLGKVCSVRI